MKTGKGADKEESRSKGTARSFFYFPTAAEKAMAITKRERRRYEETGQAQKCKKWPRETRHPKTKTKFDSALFLLERFTFFLWSFFLSNHLVFFSRNSPEVGCFLCVFPFFCRSSSLFRFLISICFPSPGFVFSYCGLTFLMRSFSRHASDVRNIAVSSFHRSPVSLFPLSLFFTIPTFCHSSFKNALVRVQLLPNPRLSLSLSVPSSSSVSPFFSFLCLSRPCLGVELREAPACSLIYPEARKDRRRGE